VELIITELVFAVEGSKKAELNFADSMS